MNVGILKNTRGWPSCSGNVESEKKKNAESRPKVECIIYILENKEFIHDPTSNSIIKNNIPYDIRLTAAPQLRLLLKPLPASFRTKRKLEQSHRFSHFFPLTQAKTLINTIFIPQMTPSMSHRNRSSRIYRCRRLLRPRRPLRRPLASRTVLIISKVAKWKWNSVAPSRSSVRRVSER